MTDIPEAIRLLIVDDEDELLDSLKKILMRRGFHVFIAEDGLKALDLLAGESIDVAVVDVKMPGIDGVELTERIKALKPDVEVLILTGHPSTGTAFRGVKAGAMEYLTKPPDIEQLVQQVQKAAGVSRERRNRVQQAREQEIDRIQAENPD